MWTSFGTHGIHGAKLTSNRRRFGVKSYRRGQAIDVERIRTKDVRPKKLRRNVETTPSVWHSGCWFKEASGAKRTLTFKETQP